MTFEHWMRHRGLSDASVRKYSSAVSGVMSAWAIEGGLLEGPLTSIQSLSRFEAVAAALRQLPIFIDRNERGNSMYNSALNKLADYLREGFDSDVEGDVDTILADSDASLTEKASLIKARIGQGGFRQKLVALWGGCAVTGYKDTAMLVASHIKPWRASSNQERLDRFNGLLLLPTLDKAFDSGLITFDAPGRVLISPLLHEPNKLGVSPDVGLQLRPEHQKYMEFHRERVFRGS